MTDTPSAADIEADIERTRRDLGDTVEALSEKFDVKAQAQHRVEDVRERGARAVARAKDAATDDQGAVTPKAYGGAAAVVFAVVAILIWRQRR